MYRELVGREEDLVTFLVKSRLTPSTGLFVRFNAFRGGVFVSCDVSCLRMIDPDFCLDTHNPFLYIHLAQRRVHFNYRKEVYDESQRD